MAYLQSSGGDPIDHDLLRSMAAAFDLTIPEDDLDRLSTAVRDQLASFNRLETLDLTGIAPVLQFDPRWQARAPVQHD